MTIKIIDQSETVEQLLRPFQDQTGADYQGYRGHVYRVLTSAMHLIGGEETHRRAVETALVFHDLGLWTDHNLAYLEPSIRRVLEANEANGWDLDPELLCNLIYWHHKVFPFRGKDADIVNAFSQGRLGGRQRRGDPSRFDACRGRCRQRSDPRARLP